MTRGEARIKVADNLDDLGLTYYSETDINDSLFDGYKRYSALTGGLLKGTFIPKPKSPYWNASAALIDYMYPAGIYDQVRNRWLLPVTIRELDSYRQDWELWTGEMSHFTPIDFRRLAIVPSLSTSSGTIFFLYKSFPFYVEDGTVFRIPKEVENIIEIYATADLLEQGKEYKKAQEYWEMWSIGITKAKTLVTNYAKADRLTVMQPFFPMGYYTKALGDDDDMHIDNEVPTGTINGINTSFTLNSTPNPGNSLVLSLNGQILFSDMGYTLSGNAINLSRAPNPPTTEDPTGDVLRAWYRIL